MPQLCPGCNFTRPDSSYRVGASSRVRYCFECRKATLRPDELRPVSADFAAQLEGVIEQIGKMRALEQARVKRWFDGRD